RDPPPLSLHDALPIFLIIGILVAIALPTYLGARQRAADKATEANLRSALAAAVTFYVDGSTYTGFTVVAAQAAEPSINWMSPGPDRKSTRLNSSHGSI